MLVRAKETVFEDGHRRRAGSVFEFGGTEVPPYLELIEPAKSEEPTAEKVVTRRTRKHEVTTSEEEVI